ncbi:MAG: polysaccharide biosynthesis C-terminal domain-containing protein [Myxococcota bacterium]|nr:polysaccharide biosynthesis C-terminal domain-containing protein [Myxococcota bacterium]
MTDGQPSSEQRRLRRDIGWNLIPVVLLGVVGLGLNFLVGGWWGATALGSFTLVTIPFFAFAVLGACGLQYAVLRAIAERPDDRDRVAVVVVGALIPTVLLAAAVTALFVVLRAPIGRLLDSDAVAEGMLWAAPGVFCFAINKVLFGVVNGLRRMRAFALYTSLRYALIGVGLVIARIWELDADQLPVIWTFTEGVLLLVMIVELFATVAVGRGAVRRFEGEGWAIWARRHLDFGARGVMATLAFEINSKIDVWLLGVALPDAQVGIYSLASALYEGVIQIAVVLQNNLNPVMARQLGLGEHREVEALARRMRRWFVPLMIAACVLGTVAYPLVIPWMIGDATFIDGALSFGIMMAGLAVASPWLPLNQLLLMAGQPGWYTIYVLGILVVNVAGNVLLIPGLGLEGAALATTASMLASAVLLRVLVRMRVGLRI